MKCLEGHALLCFAISYSGLEGHGRASGGQWAQTRRRPDIYISSGFFVGCSYLIKILREIFISYWEFLGIFISHQIHVRYFYIIRILCGIFISHLDSSCDIGSKIISARYILE